MEVDFDLGWNVLLLSLLFYDLVFYMWLNNLIFYMTCWLFLLLWGLDSWLDHGLAWAMGHVLNSAFTLDAEAQARQADKRTAARCGLLHGTHGSHGSQSTANVHDGQYSQRPIAVPSTIHISARAVTGSPSKDSLIWSDQPDPISLSQSTSA